MRPNMLPPRERGVKSRKITINCIALRNINRGVDSALRKTPCVLEV